MRPPQSPRTPSSGECSRLPSPAETSETVADDGAAGWFRWRRERGATAIETALVLACIASLVISSVQYVGRQVDRSFERVELAFVSDGQPTCSAEERSTWNAAWASHRAVRDRHQADGTWSGAANAATRSAWMAERNELFAIRSMFGC